MRLDNDFSKDTYKPMCKENDAFDPADYTAWPKCKPSA